VLVVLLALAIHLQVSQWPGDQGVHHTALMPGAALAAYAVGYAITRREGAGNEAACGVVGAVYALSGLAKLAAAGLRWVAGGPLALLIAERSLDAPAPLAALRRAVAASPAACTALAVTTLLIECGGLVFLWPRARRVYAALALVMHVGIALLMGYVYVHFALVVAALAWSSLAVGSSATTSPRR
jgi:hypothetical protein